MFKRLIIIGAGGHARVVADIAMKSGRSDIALLDDAVSGEVMGFPVIGKLADAAMLADPDTEFIAAVGSCQMRRSITEALHLPWATLIHPSAQIGADVSIGEGTVVMANAVINPCASVGRHCIINTAAVVEHNDRLGDWVHISPRAALGGTVTVGDMTHIGIGAAVRNNTDICGGCVIGAGAAVVKSITEVGTYAGVPARRIK